MTAMRKFDEPTVTIAVHQGHPTVILSTPQPDGRAKRRRVRCETMAEAEDIAARARADIEAGALTSPAAPPATLTDLGERYIASIAGKSSEAHQKWVRARIARVVKTIGDVSPGRVTTADLVRHRAARLSEGKSPVSVNAELTTVRSALAFAHEKGWIPSNPAGKSSLKLADVSAVAVTTWIRAPQYTALLSACTDDLHRFAAQLALRAGLRSGEVRGRRWQDFDDEGALLHVYNAKGQKGRWVPVSPELAKILRAEWLRQGRPAGDKPMCPTRDGEKRTGTRWLCIKTQAACRAARLPVVDFHGLRHSFASNALAAGVPLVTVSRWLGHHSPTFTAKVYAHVCERQGAIEAAKLDALTAPPTKKGKKV